MHFQFFSLSDVATTPMDAVFTANRAANVGGKSYSVQLYAGSSSDSILRIGFWYDINFNFNVPFPSSSLG